MKTAAAVLCALLLALTTAACATEKVQAKIDGRPVYETAAGKPTYSPIDSSGAPNKPLLIEQWTPEAQATLDVMQAGAGTVPAPWSTLVTGALSIFGVGAGVYFRFKNRRTADLLAELVQSIEHNPPAKEALAEKQTNGAVAAAKAVHSPELRKAVAKLTSA